MPTVEREPVVVDVRLDLKGGRHPLGRILAAVKTLARGQDLLLTAPFEPVPLYKVLALRGYDHDARQIPGGDWEVRFRPRPRGGPAGRRQPPQAPAAASTPPPTARTRLAPTTGVAPVGMEAAWSRLDNRGLEPPEPMIRTLAACNGIVSGRVLEIHNDRRPMFLYPYLEERGYRYETVDDPDGSAFVRIWLPDAQPAAEPAITPHE